MTDQQTAAPLTPPADETGVAATAPPPGPPPPELTDDEFLASLEKWQIQFHRHGVRIDSTDDQLTEIAKADAGAAASEWRAIAISQPEKMLDAVSVKLVRGRDEGWEPVDDIGVPGEPGYVRGVGREFGEPDGRTIVWRVWVTHSPESTAVEGERREDGKIVVKVPELTRRFGGVVRAMHNLGGQVRVDALSTEGLPIGYEVAVTIDPDEAEVRVHSGTDTLIIDRT